MSPFRFLDLSRDLFPRLQKVVLRARLRRDDTTPCITRDEWPQTAVTVLRLPLLQDLRHLCYLGIQTIVRQHAVLSSRQISRQIALSKHHPSSPYSWHNMFLDISISISMRKGTNTPVLHPGKFAFTSKCMGSRPSMHPTFAAEDRGSWHHACLDPLQDMQGLV